MPVEARENQKQEVGVMAIDAIYTPVKSVHFDVSNVRVGQLTNFDKLEIVMETDGGLTGQEAMDIAAHILVDHFTMMFSADFAKIESPVASEEASVIGEQAPLQEPEGENEIQSLRPFHPRQECAGQKRNYHLGRFTGANRRSDFQFKRFGG